MLHEMREVVLITEWKDTKLSDLQRAETPQIWEAKFLYRKSCLKSELEDSN